MKRILAILLCGILVFGTAGCGKEKTRTVYITQQYGTAYAPIALMQQDGILEKYLPGGVLVEWKQMENTAAIREAMLAGKTDIACMAIPPFIIGRDAGMDWKICGGVSSIPMGLVTSDESLESIADITPRHRIALPQPGSIQHILLAMAAQRQLGNAEIFDNQLVTLSHPDGMSTLISGGDVTLHFTTAPYLQQELDAGMKLLLTGAEAMGASFTGIVAVTTEDFRKENKDVYDAFLEALDEATELLTNDPAGCAEKLADFYNMTPEALLAEFTAEGAAYSTDVNGVDEFCDFMLAHGYISRDHSRQSLVFEEADA